MLTVIILTKNEEEVIADCLDSVRDISDEVLVVDSGSEDRTPDIAEKFGAKVIHHSFENFAEQRNFAMSKARGDWVLYIDADERVTQIGRAFV